MINLSKRLSYHVRIRLFLFTVIMTAVTSQAQKNDTVVAADTTSSTSQPIPTYKASKSARIIAAIGTTAAIGGIITIIFIRKSKKSGEKQFEIPDPPAPPDY